MPPKKKPAAKKAAAKPPDAAAAPRSLRHITEIYGWTGELHAQGEGLRYFEVRANDGRGTFRIMGIDAAIAGMLAGMLVPPEPTE